MAGTLELRTQKHFERLKQLESLGIKVPKTYGVSGATIYQEFIVNDKSQEVIKGLRQTKTLSEKDKQLLDQLIKMAAILDHEGYRTLDFLGDVIFDADREVFLYIDFGFDLGDKGEKASTSALENLIREFRNHKEYIGQRYLEKIESFSRQ